MAPRLVRVLAGCAAVVLVGTLPAVAADAGPEAKDRETTDGQPGPTQEAAAAAAEDTDRAGAGHGPSRPAPALPAVTPGTAKHAEDDDDAPWNSRFRLAPIRRGGNFTQTFRVSDTNRGPRVYERISMLNLRASSYIWQPWLARIAGNLNLMTGKQSGSVSNTSSTDGITGGGALALFPQSRFPFTAAFDISDNRSSTTVSSTDFRSKRLSLRQTYQPPTGNARYTASYDRSSFESGPSNSDVVTTLQAGYANSFGHQSLDANATRTTSDPSLRRAGLRATAITARHIYRPDELLRVETHASLTDTDLQPATIGFRGTNRSRYLQGYTVVSWRPGDDRPLFVTGNARIYSASTNFGGEDANSRSLSANGGVIYNPTRNLTLSGNAAAASISSAGESRIATAQSANATYTSDPVGLGRYTWSWNGTGGVTNQTGVGGGADPGALASLSHTLNRMYMLGGRSSLTFNATQTLASNVDRINGDTTTLSHFGGLAYRTTAGERTTASITLTGSDNRSRGHQRSDNQFVTLQVNAQSQLTPHSSATVNASVQWNRQSGIPGLDGRSSTHASGGAGYQNSRAFNVRGLRYSLLINVNTMPVQVRRLGDLEARRTDVGYSLDQRLEYRIGRLSARLTSTYADFLDGRNTQVFLTLQRDFGAF